MLLTIPGERHCVSSWLCIHDVSYSVLMGRDKGLKVFKINKFTYNLCRLILIFGLPNIKSKDCMCVCVCVLNNIFKNPSESMAFKT